VNLMILKIDGFDSDLKISEIVNLFRNITIAYFTHSLHRCLNVFIVYLEKK